MLPERKTPTTNQSTMGVEYISLHTHQHTVQQGCLNKVTWSVTSLTKRWNRKRRGNVVEVADVTAHMSSSSLSSVQPVKTPTHHACGHFATICEQIKPVASGRRQNVSIWSSLDADPLATILVAGLASKAFKMVPRLVGWWSFTSWPHLRWYQAGHLQSYHQDGNPA